MKEIKKEAKAQAKESKKPGAVRGIVLFLLFVILSAGGVAAGYFGYIYYTDHIRQDTNDAGLYLWEGEYVDTVGYQTTMSIEKGDRKSFYKVTICMGEENSGDLIFWDFKAYYDKESNTLRYSEATREDWIHPEDENGEEGDLVIDVVYLNGTGQLAVNKGQVTWTDNKEGFGKGKVFEKTDSTR